MTTLLRPFDSYKESENPRLGSIPSHWLVRRLRTVAQLRVSNVDKHSKKDEIPVRLCNYVDVYKNDHITDRLHFMRATATPEEIERFRLQLGDVLITKDSEAWNDIGVPALVAHEAPDLVCGYHLAILRPDKSILTGGYLHRAHQAPCVAVQYHVAANGVTRYGLTQSAIKDLILPIPPLDEQAAIVRFLDHVDRKIRRFIQAKRRLIELLNEQKQAIINQAVTRGLNPDVPLKPSGVDWLGEIPEHWEIVPLRLRYDQCLGKMVDAKRFTGAHPVPYLRNVDVQWDRINTLNLPLMDIAPHERDRFTVQPGDLLVCEGGDVGRCAFWDGDLPLCGFQKALHRLRPLDSTRDHPRFLYYCMFNASKLKVFIADGSENTIAHLTGVKLRAHRFAFPPANEQILIASHLDNATAEADAAIATVEQEISLLREYRTRLIADVVTGKLDVREAAERLPMEMDQNDAEAEPLDFDETEEGDDEAAELLSVVDDEG